MPKPPNPEDNFAEITPGKSLLLAFVACNSLAVVTEPFTAICFGKNYFRRNVLLGSVVLLLWSSAYPHEGAEIAAFGMAWWAAIAFQVAVSHYCHFLGTRQITSFVGFPIVSYVLPFGAHFCRRFVTPLIVYGAGRLVEDEALSSLIKCSAFGQFASCVFRYLIQSADDDARSDAMLTMKSR